MDPVAAVIFLVGRARRRRDRWPSVVCWAVLDTTLDDTLVLFEVHGHGGRLYRPGDVRNLTSMSPLITPPPELGPELARAPVADVRCRASRFGGGQVSLWCPAWGPLRLRPYLEEGDLDGLVALLRSGGDGG